MTEGDRHSVCGIVRLWYCPEIQYPFGHIHDLTFFRLAIADHSLLDLGGRIFINRDSGSFGRRQNNTTRLRHTDAGGHIIVEKKLLYSHRLRMKYSDELIHILLNLEQSRRQREPCLGGDGTALD